MFIRKMLESKLGGDNFPNLFYKRSHIVIRSKRKRSPSLQAVRLIAANSEESNWDKSVLTLPAQFSV